MVAFCQSNNIVAMKGDRDKNPEVDTLLVSLGNSSKAIPYYAVYTEAGGEPVHFDGVFLSTNQFLKKLEPALVDRLPVATRSGGSESAATLATHQ